VECIREYLRQENIITGEKIMKKIFSSMLIILLVLTCTPGLAQQKSFQGQTVVVVTQTGRSIAGPVEDHWAEWGKLTGGKVQLQQFAFGELFEKIITSFETGAGTYDMLIFPADWAGDFMSKGYLEPISQATLDKVNIKDVIPLYSQRITSWGKTAYALPFDGDAHMLYYRKDVLENKEFAAAFEKEYGYPLAEPKTWKQYLDMAKFFNGKEVETAGKKAPIYGVLEAQRRNAQSYWVFLSHAAGYGKIPGNPCFFFSCDDLKPQVNNPGWVRALTDYVELSKYGPAEMINYDVSDTRIHFPAGVSVFNIDWGDVGPISVDKERSVIGGKTGFSVLPGGDQYWDYVKGAWVKPENGVNTAPFIAFGGWIIGVSAKSKVKEAALDFATFMASPEMVKLLAVTPDTGVNPSRFSQLDDVDIWVKAGFDRDSAVDYLDAVKNTINHPNAVLDLRIIGAAEYLQTLDVEISRAVAKEINPQQAMDNVAKAWEEITNRLGRENQLKQYRDAVGWSK
jgi:multiple sugar transport system substrate-binding protein